ncbi:MAG: WcaF family extracellular polysaccharide biosynthesis acetyltransferase [Limisphaerales bacterium]
MPTDAFIAPEMTADKCLRLRVRNDLFDASKGLDRGRPFLVEALWYLTKCLLFLNPLPVPSRFKCEVLRWFGARVGKGVVIKPRVNIHLPWKLAIGDFSWIGEEVFILSFEPISIGAHCCISQRAFLCAGDHDYHQPDMRYRNQPITVEDGAWVGAQVFVAPGVTIGAEAVITAGSVVTKDQPESMVCGGNPCVAIKPRWLWQTKPNEFGPRQDIAPLQTSGNHTNGKCF